MGIVADLRTPDRIGREQASVMSSARDRLEAAIRETGVLAKGADPRKTAEVLVLAAAGLSYLAKAGIPVDAEEMAACLLDLLEPTPPGTSARDTM